MKECDAKLSRECKPRLSEALEHVVQLYDPGAPGGQARPGRRVAEVAGTSEPVTLECGDSSPLFLRGDLSPLSLSAATRHEDTGRRQVGEARKAATSRRTPNPTPNAGAPRLLSACEGMKERDAKTPGAIVPGSPLRQRQTEALERLVKLYDDWGKPEEATAWRKGLEELKTNQNEPKDSPKN